MPLAQRPESSWPFWFGSCLTLSCCCSVAKSCPTLRPRELQRSGLPCPSLSPGVCSDFMSMEWVMLSNHLILSLLLLPSIFPSIRVFSSESALRISVPHPHSLSSDQVLHVDVSLNSVFTMSPYLAHSCTFTSQPRCLWVREVFSDA